MSKKPTSYIQIFSLTDHVEALQGRHQGAYSGLNADLQTSALRDNGTLCLAKGIQTKEGPLQESTVECSQAVIAYRHSDTGALSGTSESVYALQDFPWTDMPGLELRSISQDANVDMRLWEHDIRLRAGETNRVHFGKTIVYLKNWGRVDAIEWVEEPLQAGPASLHQDDNFVELTLAPASGSALLVKQGQELKH